LRITELISTASVKAAYCKTFASECIFPYIFRGFVESLHSVSYSPKQT